MVIYTNTKKLLLCDLHGLFLSGGIWVILYLGRCPNSAIIGRYLFVGVVSIIVHIYVCDRDL